MKLKRFANVALLPMLSLFIAVVGTAGIGCSVLVASSPYIQGETKAEDETVGEQRSVKRVRYSRSAELAQQFSAQLNAYRRMAANGQDTTSIERELKALVKQMPLIGERLVFTDKLYRNICISARVANDFEAAIEVQKQRLAAITEVQQDNPFEELILAELHSLERIANLTIEQRTAISNARSRLNEISASKSTREIEQNSDEILSIFESVAGTKDVLTADARLRIGKLIFMSGLPGWEKLWQDAAKHYEQELGPGNLVSLHIDLDFAKAYRLQGKLYAAEKSCLRAVEGLSKIFDSDFNRISMLGYERLARIYSRQHRHVAARLYFEKTLQMMIELYGTMHPHVAHCNLDLSLEFSYTSYTQKSYAHADNAIKILEHAEPTPQTNWLYAAAYSSRGFDGLLLGHEESAVQDLRKAIEILGKESIRDDRYFSVLLSLAKAEATVGRNDEARRLLIQAKKELESASGLGQKERFIVSFGVVHLDLREYQQAVDILLKVIPSLGKQDADLLLDATTTLGRCYCAMGDFAASRKHHMKAIDIQHTRFSQNIVKMSEREAIVNAMGLHNSLSSLFAVDEYTKADSARLFTTTNLGKGVLSQLMIDRQQLLRQSSKEDLVEEFYEVASRLDAVVVRAGLTQHQPGEHYETLDRQKRKMFDQIVVDVDVSGTNSPSSIVKRLEDCLPSGVALLEFIAGQVVDVELNSEHTIKKYFCFVVRKLEDGSLSVETVSLGNVSDVNEMVYEFQKTLAKPGDRGVERAKQSVKLNSKLGFDIRKALWEPIEEKLGGCSHVVICPANYLSTLPWAALPGKKENQFLLHQYTISYETNATFVARTLDNDENQPGDFLLVGNVDYGRRQNGAGMPFWNSIPETLGEVQGIRNLLKPSTNVNMLAGPQASEKNLLEKISGASFLHLASHGFALDKRTPDPPKQRTSSGTNVITPTLSKSEAHPFSLTGIVLAGANQAGGVEADPSLDGYLSGETIMRMNLDHIELAVLSSCDAGRGRVSETDGTFGLADAFRLAGARSVIASSWNVDDKLTKDFMIEFYNNLVIKKLPKAEALRQAQLHFAEKVPPEYWASWKLRGDWR